MRTRSISSTSTRSSWGLPSTISCAIRLSVRSIASPSRTVFASEVCALRAQSGRCSPSTPFRPHRTELKGCVCRGGTLADRPDSDRDQPFDSVLEALRQLLLGSGEAGLVLVFGDQVEGGDVLAADLLERLGAGVRPLLRQVRELDLRE